MEKNDFKRTDIEILTDLKRRIKKLKKREEELELLPLVDEKYKYMYDPDSSLRAWQYYLVTYADLLKCDSQFIKNLFEENFTSKFGFYKGGNPFMRIIGAFIYEDDQYELSSEWKLGSNALVKKEGEKKNIGIAGDCVFNFNEKRLAKFWHNLNSRGEDCPDHIKQMLRNVLLLCNDIHHAVYNFSLMPTNGNMQAVKGGKQEDTYDRLGLLLHKVENYYNKKDKEILKYAKKRNRDALDNFLQSIGSVENYCKIFYHIDTEGGDKDVLFKTIMESGTYKMTEYKDIIKYISLAVSYWEYQADYFDKQWEKINQSQNIIK